MPVVLLICPTQWPMYKSTTDVVITCVTPTHEERDCITIPALAGNSREAESNIDPSIQLPDRRAKPSRISKLTIGNKCCDSGECSSANSRNCRSAKSTADAIDQGTPNEGVQMLVNRVLPHEGDAALVSPQRQIAMPSPARSRRSRRRDLVALDQDKKSVEVILGQTLH